MKRFALVFAALALTGVMAYADDAMAAPAPVTVTIGSWGRQIFAVGSQDTSGYWLGTGQSWGNAPRGSELTFTAKTDNAGFAVTPSFDGNTISIGDEAKGWVSPLPGLTVESGYTLETDTWRGTSDFGSDDWIRFQGYQQSSFTFFRLGEGGLATDINYNKDGIGAWALISGAGTSNLAAAQDIGSSLQIGAAYTIPGTAQIKAQYVGYSVAGTTLQGTTRSPAVATGNGFGQIQIAANINPMLKGLQQEVGIDIPMSATDAGYAFQVSDITDVPYQMAVFHLMALVTDFNGNLSTSGGSGIGLLGGIGADYDLGNKVGLNGDIRYGNALGSASGANGGTALTGVMVGITKSFDHGLIGIGFEYSTSTIGAGSGSAAGNANSVGANNAGDAHWAIPVKLEESF